MMTVKPAKKSETIEVRLSHEAKTAFMARCQEDRHSASEAIRQFIDLRIQDRALPRQSLTARWRLLAAGLIGALLGLGAAAPSLARSTDGSHAAFHRLDRNGDGVLSYAEYHASH